MTDKQTIFLTWLVIFTVAFMGMVAVQEHVHQDKRIEASYTGSISSVHIYDLPLTAEEISLHFDGNGDYVRIDMNTGVAEYHESEKTTDDILNIHGFKDWSESDQELLTQMMQGTAAGALGIKTDLSFEELASIAPVHVLETYIDLLESAGY